MYSNANIDYSARSASNLANRNYPGLNLEASPKVLEQNDKDFVKRWSTSVKLNKNLKHKCKKKYTLPELKTIILEIKKKYEKIQEIENYSRDNVSTLPSKIWDMNMFEIEKISEEIRQMECIYTDGDLLEEVVKAKRRNYVKRERIKMKKQLNKEKKQTQKEKHNEIDNWLNKMKEEIQYKERENQMLKRRDIVLRDVTKYKTEARRNIALLEHLLKLRHAKEKSALGMGKPIDETEKAIFTNNIDKLMTLWNSALNKYNDEEIQLRQTLQSKQQMENIIPPAVVDQKDTMTQWRRALFGDDLHLPLQRDFNGDLLSFITMRRKWDTFLSEDEDSNKMPSGWVIPPATTKHCWNRYLVQ